MNTLESEWLRYRDACYPEKAKISKTQEIETRQAFFAGCLVVLKTAVEGAMKLSEKEAVERIHSLITEALEECDKRVAELKARN